MGRVLERHPDGFVAQPGYVWLDTPGKVLAVSTHLLEFTQEPRFGRRLRSPCRVHSPRPTSFTFMPEDDTAAAVVRFEALDSLRDLQTAGWVELEVEENRSAGGVVIGRPCGEPRHGAQRLVGGPATARRVRCPRTERMWRARC
jgi:hypothetical protein